MILSPRICQVFHMRVRAFCQKLQSSVDRRFPQEDDGLKRPFISRRLSQRLWCFELVFVFVASRRFHVSCGVRLCFFVVGFVKFETTPQRRRDRFLFSERARKLRVML